MTEWTEDDDVDQEKRLKYFSEQERLQSEKERLEVYIKRRNFIFPVLLLSGIFFIGLTISVLDHKSFLFTPALIYSVTLSLFSFYFKPKSEFKYRIVQIDNEVDLLNISYDSPEKKAEKLFKNHQFELKRYYDQTLNHSSQIFYVGLICILIGFTIIGGTIWVLTTPKFTINFHEQVVIASLSALGNLLTGYIGSIYLKMFSEITNSLNEFHSKLVLTHNLHLSNYLASKIEDANLRESVIKEMVIEIAKK